jgi:3-methyladenine DNA glycosylase AlkD
MSGLRLGQYSGRANSDSGMQRYLQPLVRSFNEHADPDVAAKMAAYMRDQFPFVGLPTPKRQALFKAFLAAHGRPAQAVVRALWALPEREYQYCAVDLLKKERDALPASFLPVLEFLVVTKSWWDTVDALASHPVGALLARFPGTRAAAIARWRVADNLWLRRTALLFQLRYKTQTDQELLFALIRENAGSREFFIQKAIGWALREYSKVEAQAVRDFVAATPLAPLSRHEALTWLKATFG